MKVIDASIAVKLVLREQGSQEALTLWTAWMMSGEVAVAPPLFAVETASAVRRQVHRRLMSAHDGDDAFHIIRNLAVELIEPPGLYDRAWDLAKTFNRPTVYDSCYLALADLLQCELWTADNKLVQAVGNQFPLLKQLASRSG